MSLIGATRTISCGAAILTSTRAVATASIDKFSDVDVILALTEIGPLSDHRLWLTDFGEVLAAWRDTDALQSDPPRTCRVTQYADGSKIDFTLWPVALLRQVAQSGALPDQLDVGYRVLVDKDGLTGGLKSPAIARISLVVPPMKSSWPSSRTSCSSRRTWPSTSSATT